MSFNRSCEIQNAGKHYDLTPVDHPKLLCKKSCSFEAAMKSSQQAPSEPVRIQLAKNYENLILRVKALFSSVTNQELKLIDHKCLTESNIHTGDTIQERYNFAHDPNKNMSGGIIKGSEEYP